MTQLNYFVQKYLLITWTIFLQVNFEVVLQQVKKKLRYTGKLAVSPVVLQSSTIHWKPIFAHCPAARLPSSRLVCPQQSTASQLVPAPGRLHSMWCPCLLLALIAIDLDSSFGSTGAEPSVMTKNRLPPPDADESPFRDLSQKAAEAGRVVGEEIQQRLEPFER